MTYGSSLGKPNKTSFGQEDFLLYIYIFFGLEECTYQDGGRSDRGEGLTLNDSHLGLLCGGSGDACPRGGGGGARDLCC